MAITDLDPKHAAMVRSIGGLRRAATDREGLLRNLAAGRRTQDARFPNAAARRLYFKELAWRSVQARKAKRQAGQ